jgi:hypothetical protein
LPFSLASRASIFATSSDGRKVTVAGGCFLMSR